MASLHEAAWESVDAQEYIDRERKAWADSQKSWPAQV